MARPKRDQNEKTTEAGFRIRRRVLPSGTEVFLVDLGKVAGKRHRQQFPSLTAARNFCHRKATERERVGLAAFALTDRDREDAIRALRLLAGTGASLTVAAEAYARKHAPPDNSVTLRDVCDAFTEWMQTTPQKLNARSPGQYRPVTIEGTARQLARICRDLGDTPAVAVTSDELRAWLDSQSLHPLTWDGIRRCVGMAYAWATRDGGPLRGCGNPAAGMKPPAMAERLPAILTPEAAERVLRFAEREKNGRRLVASLACGFFAGLRPEELRRITPAELDFDAGEIRVPADAAKTHRERLVTMPANLRAWLEKYPPPAGKPLALSTAALTRFRARLRPALLCHLPLCHARHGRHRRTAWARFYRHAAPPLQRACAQPPSRRPPVLRDPAKVRGDNHNRGDRTMEAGESARLTWYALRSVEGFADTAEAFFQTRAVYGQPGNGRWHRGRVQLEDGRSVAAVVRDLAAGTPAGKAWRAVGNLAKADGWGRGGPWLVTLRRAVERDLAQYADAARAEAVYAPGRTQDALRRLERALAKVASDPVALRQLDAGQGQAYDLAAALWKPVPAGAGQGRTVVHARELAERLHKSATEALKLHAAANRRGRKTQSALHRLVFCLANRFELMARRRATVTPGGPFARFLAAAMGYHAALTGTAAPTIGARVLRSALREYRARYPWPPWRDVKRRNPLCVLCGHRRQGVW